MAEPATVQAQTWYFVAMLSAIGGQGKTLFSELVVWILRSLGHEVEVFSADVQQRLGAKLVSGVVTIDTDLLETSDDPFKLLRAFSPLSEAVARSAETGKSIVLDTAAGWDIAIIRLLREARLDELIAASGGQMIIALVTTSNRDAMRAMTASTELVRAALPSARPVWVLNERVGAVFPRDFDPGLLDMTATQFARIRKSVSEVVLARMDDRIWQPVDRAPGLNLLNVVTTDPAQLGALWSDAAGRPLDRIAAAVVQRRVAAWIARMMEEAATGLGFPGSAEQARAALPASRAPGP